MIDHCEIQKVMDEITAREDVPCIGLGFLSLTQQDMWISGFKSLIPNKEAIQMDTIFDMASLTKVMVTSTLILKLIEEGKLKLETKVSSILEDFSQQEVTIVQLLSHTSGLPSDDKGYRNHCSKIALRKFIMGLPFVYEPGTQVLYSDFGFILLGFIIESFMGALDEAAQQVIFDPLNMKDTCFKPQAKDRCAPTEDHPTRGLLKGVVHDGKAFCMGEVSGNAGLFSTLSDTMTFARMLLSDDERVLKNSTKALLHTSTTEQLNFNRTLGWFRNDPSWCFGPLVSQDVLYHTGFSGTSIYIDFDCQIAIVVLTNRVHPSRDNDKIKTVRATLHNHLLELTNLHISQGAN